MDYWLYTPHIAMSPQSLLAAQDRLWIQLGPENPQFIDAYIRQIRREMKPRKKGFWEWLTRR